MPDVRSQIKVAIGTDFLTAFSRVPRNQQSKVMDFVNKFKSNPDSAGINLEKIHEFKDPNLRSVRIDQAYRGIVLKPEAGNVYILLWVDHHDEAYKWAKNKVYQINPETGSIQVVDTKEISKTPTISDRATRKESPGLFDKLRDRELIRLGVPELLIPLVRSVRTEDDLDKLELELPQEAYEALFLLAAGDALDDVYREMEKEKLPVEININDFVAALANPDSQRRFYVVEDDLELIQMLNAPLEKWRVFLHPTQRKLVETRWNGPTRVLGGAGTGKTVVAMHRAKWLAQNVYTGSNDRILFTTFTSNLAADIKDNLGKICSDDVMRRIEVVNLDKWVSDFLRKHSYDSKIDYGPRITLLWEKALAQVPKDIGLPESFYREEWEKTVQPQEIRTLADYLKVSRVGRGVPLNRKMRSQVWAVFEEYRVLLKEHDLKEAEDAMVDARQLLAAKGSLLPYRAVIVDEAQDMGNQAFKLIRQMIPCDKDGHEGDIFIVGDSHQRIYRHKVTLSRCGINIRGRSRTLWVNYRTTEEIRRLAVGLLKGLDFDDLDQGTDNQPRYHSLLHGVAPEVRQFDSFSQEVAGIVTFLERIQKQTGTLNTTCLVVRTQKLIEQYKIALEENGIKTCLIRRSQPEDRNVPGLRLATMHRVKGLEFDQIIIAGVNDGIIPLESKESESGDYTVRQEMTERESLLLYVALTRAKKEVLITNFGKPSRLL